MGTRHPAIHNDDSNKQAAVSKGMGGSSPLRQLAKVKIRSLGSNTSALETTPGSIVYHLHADED